MKRIFPLLIIITFFFSCILKNQVDNPNMQPKEDMQPLHNLMLTMAKKGLGTHKYQGQWSFLDQFYVSSSLRDCSTAEIYSPEWLQEEDTRYLGMKPRRTFVGFRYRRNGFSDHLPILLRVNRP